MANELPDAPDLSQELLPAPALFPPGLIAPLPTPAPLPGPTAPPTSVMQNPNARALALGALVSALVGGPRNPMAGVPLGVLGGLHNIDQQNQQTYQQQEQLRQKQNATL